MGRAEKTEGLYQFWRGAPRKPGYCTALPRGAPRKPCRCTAPLCEAPRKPCCCTDYLLVPRPPLIQKASFLGARSWRAVQRRAFLGVNFENWYRGPVFSAAHTPSTVPRQEKGPDARASGPEQSWWRRGDSNPRPLPCEGSALPAELRPQAHRALVIVTFCVSRVNTKKPSPAVRQ